MIETRHDVAHACGQLGIPERMWDGVERYLFDRIRPGAFVAAVLENDLRRAVGYADEENLRLLRAWVLLLHNEFPSASHSSPDALRSWLASRAGPTRAGGPDGMEGMARPMDRVARPSLAVELRRASA